MVSRQDRSDTRSANDAIIILGQLQHSQDHRLTTAEQATLTESRRILRRLSDRIKNDAEA